VDDLLDFLQLGRLLVLSQLDVVLDEVNVLRRRALALEIPLLLRGLQRLNKLELLFHFGIRRLALAELHLLHLKALLDKAARDVALVGLSFADLTELGRAHETLAFVSAQDCLNVD